MLLPCPAGPSGTPAVTRSTRSAGRRVAVEHLLDDRPRPPGGAAVVLDELPGVDVRSVPAGAGDPDQLRTRARQLVAGPAADQEDRVAGTGGELPGGLQRLGLLVVQQVVIA